MSGPKGPRPKRIACVCQSCGAAFMASRPAKGCGNTCRARMSKGYESHATVTARRRASSPLYTDRTCARCGTTYRPKKSRPTKFCSRACGFAGQRYHKRKGGCDGGT